ncbi:MAG TPA: hypothetical protein PKK12_09385, partial [Candidatus Aminicenantes bacterium]|nr:hypothetical protein [Candidatus Aminicenantes bacterium]
GAFQTCPTCVIDIPVLAAGQEVAAAPRQFNNANGAPSKFRATADCTGLVAESNEGNNRLERTFIQMVIKETGPLPIHKD